jgi:colanic acid/amylovoran biosynthesis glycosyltransferase
MVLHLERKFTAPTEVFIADQINFQKEYKNIVFAAQQLNNLKIDAEVFEGPDHSKFSLKFMGSKQKAYFKEKYNELKPAIIHGHFLTDTSYFHPFTSGLAVPKVCSAYGYDISSFPKSYMGMGKHFFRRIFNEYDYFLAMSNDMANDFIKIGCPSNKVKVHYYGIDSQRFKADRTYANKEVFNILTIGSLVPKKGHLTILKSLVRLKAMLPALKFEYNIIGKGVLEEQLKKFVAENGLSDHVHFRGHIKHGEEFSSYLNNADVFVHPSVTGPTGDKEGIPGTLVEAMANGLPVISTYHAGIPEVVKSNYNGLLIKEHDDLNLAEFLSELSSDSEKRKLLGTNARLRAVNEFDIRVKTAELISIYKELL